MDNENPESVNQESEEPVYTPPQPQWNRNQAAESVVHVETGRGSAVDVPVGSPFLEIMERLAEEAHYGGYFRVFLNGSEIVNPEEAPPTIDVGMRLALTAYDKVG